MAFRRYANASVVTTHLQDGGWDRVRVASGQLRADRDLVSQASKILGQEFSPSKFLLTHATIVASVDTYNVPGVKLGSATVDGKTVVRKTEAFRIRPACDMYINNNLDSWSRPVLLKSYKTFVGGHSFLEHVQVEELSKGRILDAVARDLGDSVYVDILVANDRKHTELIRDIETGEISTLSMGCSIDGSTCTKCGHWAADETEMCEHIRYAKGNVFYDERGQRHRIAELCGDDSLEPTGGVTFIEASWVKVPAFKGAVARNVVTLENGRMAYEIQTSFSQTPVAAEDAQLKAASVKKADEDFTVSDDMPTEEPAESSEEPPAEEMPPSEPPKSPFADVEDELTNSLVDRVRKRVKDQMSQSEGAPAPRNDNNNMLREAREALNLERLKRAKTEKTAKAVVYQAALRAIVATASQDADLVDKIATLNDELGIFVSQSVYRAALKVGPSEKYGNLNAYVGACQKALGKDPSVAETKTLIRLGALLSAYGKKSRVQ